MRDAVLLNQRDLERLSLCNMLFHRNYIAFFILLHKKSGKKELVIIQIPSFLNISPTGYSDLQRTLNHLDHPVSIYSMLKTIYLLAIYKRFGLYFHDFSWDNVQHF